MNAGASKANLLKTMGLLSHYKDRDANTRVGEYDKERKRARESESDREPGRMLHTWHKKTIWQNNIDKFKQLPFTSPFPSSFAHSFAAPFPSLPTLFFYPRKAHTHALE